MDGFQVVCFAVGPYRCALEILAVREIIEPTPPSPLPRAAPGVEGVIELRGAFLPVVDLRKRLGVAVGPPGKYVVAQPAPEQRVALVVDQVHDVRRWRHDQLAAPPALALGSGPPCVRGVVKQGDEVVMLLELAQLLDSCAIDAVAV
jgi:purine-binding chemotaxis protein CheW